MKGKNNTFIVKVMSTENASWQGTITWVEENKALPYRSTLELIKLMDSVIEGNIELVTKDE